jgi:hypothetical protein
MAIMPERIADKNKVPLSDTQRSLINFVDEHTAPVELENSLNQRYLANGLYVMEADAPEILQILPVNVFKCTSVDQIKPNTSRSSEPQLERVDSIDYIFLADTMGHKAFEIEQSDSRRHAGELVVARLLHKRDLVTYHYEDGGSFHIENVKGNPSYFGGNNGEAFVERSLRTLRFIEEHGHLTRLLPIDEQG